MSHGAPATAAHWIAEYLAHLTVERNLARRTVAAYGRDVEAFARWLGEQKLDL